MLIFVYLYNYYDKGTQQECEEKEKSILQYIQDETLKQSISRKPTNKKQASNITENQEACKQKQLEAEISDLYQKLTSKDEQIDKLTDKMEQLSSELKSEKDKSHKLESSIDQLKESVNSGKLIAIALSIINNLAKPSDLSELNIFDDETNNLDDPNETVNFFMFFL